MDVLLQLPVPVPDHGAAIEWLRTQYPAFTFGATRDLLDHETGQWSLSVTPDPTPAQINAVQTLIDGQSWQNAATTREARKQAWLSRVDAQIDGLQNANDFRAFFKRLVRYIRNLEDL